MPQTPEAEAPKATRRKSEARGNGMETFLPFNFFQFQTDSAATMTRANEILVNAARSIWENEAELFRLETENARASFEPMKAGAAPSHAFPEAMEQWRRNTEKAIGHMRAINDAMRECEWQLLTLAARNFANAQPKAND